MARLVALLVQPDVVFQCQVNQEITTSDKVYQVQVNNLFPGTIDQATHGMTVYVGTTPGAWDRGITYIRKQNTNTSSPLLYVGEGSEVYWADDLWLTVVNSWAPWAEPLRIAEDGTVYMRFDEAYTNQHALNRVVTNMGPDRAKRIQAGQATFTISASASFASAGFWDFGWSAPGADSLSLSPDHQTATITYDTPGRYIVYCTAVTSNFSRTTQREVIVYDDAMVHEIEAGGFLTGELERGSWAATFNCITDVGVSIPRYTKVLIVDDDGGDGIVPDAGNVLFVGWTETETVTSDEYRGSLTIRAKGLGHWLNQMTGFSSYVKSVTKAPTKWTEFQDLTVDKAIYHLLAWRTTVMECADCLFTGNTQRLPDANLPLAKLGQQLRELVERTINARTGTNKIGMFYAFMNQQLLPMTDRAGIPTVADLTRDDYESWSADFDLPQVSRVELSGIYAESTSSAKAFFSLAPGHVFTRLGEPFTIDRLLLKSQAHANELAALYFAWKNLPFRGSFEGLSDAREIDLAPAAFFTAEITDDDNRRGLAYSGNFVPTNISYSYARDAGVIKANLQAEPEAIPGLAVNGDIPTDPGEDNWEPPSMPPAPLPPILPVPPVIIGGQPRFGFLLTTVGLFYTETLDQDSPVWIDLSGSFTEDDYLAGFAGLAVNQSGRYYVATRRQVYSGAAGYAPTLIAPESYFLPKLPQNPPFYAAYFLAGIGCNHAATDEYAVAGTLSYPTNISKFFYGSSGGLTDFTLSFPIEGAGSISWGPNGILMTHITGIAGHGQVVRLDLAGAGESYTHQLNLNYGATLYHNRPFDLDRVLGLHNGVGTVSSFFTDDGEIQTDLTKQLDAGATDETGLKILGAENTSPFKSTDGGSVWTAISPFPKTNSSNSFLQAVGGEAFVWAVRGNPGEESPGVYFTPDMGATFIDKTGDLLDLTGPTFGLAGLRVFL